MYSTALTVSDAINCARWIKPLINTPVVYSIIHSQLYI